MKEKSDLHHNRVYHLEDTMIMYGKYNSDTLKDLINTVHHMQHLTSWKEKMFVGKMTEWVKKELAKSKHEYSYSVDTILFLTTVKEKYVKMYERFIAELKSYLKTIRVLSKGYLPISLIPPSKLQLILSQVKAALAKTNKDYDLVLSRLYLYYDMKLFTFGIDQDKNLIIQFPMFVQPYTQIKLTLYQIETVPMLILDGNDNAQSYTQLKVEKPYIAVNRETYISLCPQELNTCKRIGYEHFCEELFVVKSKHKYSCASAVYFNLEEEIKQNCEYEFYFSKTNIMPSVLDGGHQIVLANWPNHKRTICTHNNNIPVNIPHHLYVLLDRNIQCNCDIEAESNFLLESLAACSEHENENSDLEMYFTVNLAFVNYLDQLDETIDEPIERKWAHQMHVLPISIEPFLVSQNLMQGLKTLKDYINQYQENRRSLNMKEKKRTYI